MEDCERKFNEAVLNCLNAWLENLRNGMDPDEAAETLRLCNLAARDQREGCERDASDRPDQQPKPDPGSGWNINWGNVVIGVALGAGVVLVTVSTGGVGATVGVVLIGAGVGGAVLNNPSPAYASGGGNAPKPLGPAVTSGIINQNGTIAMYAFGPNFYEIHVVHVVSEWPSQ